MSLILCDDSAQNLGYGFCYQIVFMGNRRLFVASVTIGQTKN